MTRATVALGFLVCGLLLACVLLWRELGEERAINAQLQARLDAVPAPAPKTAVVNTTVALAPPTVAHAPAPSPVLPPPPNSPPASPSVKGRQEDWEEARRRMMSDPRFREAQREQFRLNLSLRRANLIRLLGFTPEQADAVIDLQIDQDFQRQEQMTNISTPEQHQQYRQRAEAREAEHQAKLQALLGQEKAGRLEHYMETRQTRMQVDNFRTQLNGADVLRDDQVEPLIEALHVERSKMEEELDQYRETLELQGNASPEAWRQMGQRRAELLKSMHADMRNSASAILSTSQLEQLNVMLNRELQRYQAQERMNQLQSKLDRANAPPQSQ